VCSTPVIFNIKRTYPESHVAVLVSKKALGIIKNHPKIDELIVIENYSWFGLIHKLRESNFNWSMSLSATSTSTSWVVWSLIAHRIKTVVETPPITEKMTDWMANHRILYKNHTFLPHHHTRLLSFMGITSPQDTREVFVSNDAEQKVEMWRKKIPAQVRIVGISISAGNKIKELGDDKFAHIARTLLAKKDTAIVCIGSPADIPRIKKFIADVGSPLCFDGTGFNLEELPSLMKRFSLYIAVDTGPIYIAHALGIPLIDIIGPVDPTEQPPKDARSIQVLPRGNVEPSSFVFKKRGEPQQIKQALEMTFTDDILSAAFSLLK
jgi:ADP-heptose:LPS heptosyltransferase